MTSCQEVTAALSSLLDGETSPEVRTALEAHLDECRRCKGVYETTRQTLRIVAESGSFELSADLSDRIRSRVWASLPSPRGG